VTNGSGEPHKVSFDYGTRSQNFVVATGLPNSTFVAQLTTEGAGNLCVTTYSPTDLIVDVAGSLGGATTTAPHRVACSAPGPGNYVSGTQLQGASSSTFGAAPDPQLAGAGQLAELALSGCVTADGTENLERRMRRRVPGSRTVRGRRSD